MPYGGTFHQNQGANLDEDVGTHINFTRHADINIYSSNFKEGIDYHKLTYEHRSINLDTVTAPQGKTVTGVRFHKRDDKTLELQIRATDFDFETGKNHLALRNANKYVWVLYF